jgi:hypothetical protein
MKGLWPCDRGATATPRARGTGSTPAAGPGGVRRHWRPRAPSPGGSTGRRSPESSGSRSGQRRGPVGRGSRNRLHNGVAPGAPCACSSHAGGALRMFPARRAAARTASLRLRVVRRRQGVRRCSPAPRPSAPRRSCSSSHASTPRRSDSRKRGPDRGTAGRCPWGCVEPAWGSRTKRRNSRVSPGRRAACARQGAEFRSVAARTWGATQSSPCRPRWHCSRSMSDGHSAGLVLSRSQ